MPIPGTRIAVLLSRRLAEAGIGNGTPGETLTMSTPKANDNDAIKDPAEWTTGDEPMTGAQDSYLHTLARKAGEEVKDDMTKAEASQKIDELRQETGRAGKPAGKKRASSRKKS